MTRRVVLVSVLLLLAGCSVGGRIGISVDADGEITITSKCSDTGISEVRIGSTQLTDSDEVPVVRTATFEARWLGADDEAPRAWSSRVVVSRCYDPTMWCGW